MVKSVIMCYMKGFIHIFIKREILFYLQENKNIKMEKEIKQLMTERKENIGKINEMSFIRNILNFKTIQVFFKYVCAINNLQNI